MASWREDPARAGVGPGWLDRFEELLRQGRPFVVEARGWRERHEALEAVSRYQAALERADYDLLTDTWTVTPRAGAEAAEGRGASGEIRSAYSTGYYRGDCGGFGAFARWKGARAEDNQLTLAELGGAAPRGRALDLGSGRGEVSFELSRLGFVVTAIDYSADAVSLARGALDALSPASRNVQFHCADVNAFPLDGKFALAAAGDLIEHLNPLENDRLYSRVAACLEPEGLFVVHTFPNLWHYRYDYPRRQRLAAAAGAFLPEEPRTRFERMMHINEQSPRVLRRQLRRHFAHVLLWFGSPAEPVEHLRRRFSCAQMRRAPDLFAVASHLPLDPARLLRRFEMQALGGADAARIGLARLEAPAAMRAGGEAAATVRVENGCGADLKGLPPHPVRLAYHWYDAASGECVVFEGRRSDLRTAIRAGQAMECEMRVHAPERTGPHRLRLTLVQEGIRWFDSPPAQTWCDVEVLLS